MKPKLIPTWRSAWRLWSVQIAAAIVALAAFGPYAGELAGFAPDSWARYIFGALGVIAIIARVLKQKEPPT